MSILVVHRHRINLQNIFSNILENHKISWLLFLIAAYLIYIISVTLWGFWGFITSNLESVTFYNYFASLFLTFAIGFYGIKQDDIFGSRVADDQKVFADKNFRYKQSLLSLERKMEIKQLNCVVSPRC